YIRDSRTIVLAVLPCTVDIATQEILAFAEEADKMGERTLGILTKPDLVRECSAKAVVCNLVQGTKRPLTLGYYVVRNRGGDDDQVEDYNVHEREEMFKEDPWHLWPDDRVGIDALRERLQELLGQIMDKAFLKLRAETRHILTHTQESLAKLGPPRQTEREQQQYLAAVAGKFQAIVRAALDADYSQFSLQFQACSHAYRFGGSSVEEGALAFPNDDRQSYDSEGYDGNHSEAAALPDEDFQGYNSEVDSSDQVPGLDAIIVREGSTPEPKAGIMAWISRMHRRLRGPELGTFGLRLLSNAFCEQSVRWGSMTKQYLSKIVLVTHKFILKTLKEVCTDSKVREELISIILGELLDRYAKGIDHAMYLVDVERDKW
ncbi:hypothetical protein BGZ61DRAFT_368317, partial [Ilyonectria robusta]|uniref:uncharacterized protein n=1 Tax=Ilyonectria robusta TaxID=1079257 RepID=UPI001E8CD6D8